MQTVHVGVRRSGGTMNALGEGIATVRESVVAIMRIREVRPKKKGGKNGKPVEERQFSVSFGSGFCVVDDRFIVTAFHVLNEGKPPDPSDRHYAFTVPGNGAPAYRYPVSGIPIQHQDSDLAVLELGPCATPDRHLPGLPVSFEAIADGESVLTLGFPAPEVHGLNIDAQGNYRGGQFFLKSHANEGIVSAQYNLGPLHVYELNVGWHNGESGGPIVTLGDAPAAFSLMQQYRNVQTPHGIVPGPHRGVALDIIKDDLLKLGMAAV